MAPDIASQQPSPRIANEINTATRSVHTHLNRLITSRLPLALPPHAASPRLYASGLLHFAHVYLTFESSWRDIATAATATSLRNPALSSLLEDPWIAVSTPNLASAAASTTLPSTAAAAPANPDLLPLLAALVPQGLPRSRRLRSDLSTLLDLSPVDLDVQLSVFPGPAVRTFAEHIRRSLRAKPHLLVAYTWVLYMAVFSGGRYIRAELAAAGEPFWGREMRAEDLRDGELLKDIGLGFWGFDGASDGEDVKAEYKARLAAVDDALSAEERADIVAEAKTIFESCRLLVEELDVMMDTPAEKRTPTPPPAPLPGIAAASEKQALQAHPAQQMGDESSVYLLPKGYSVTRTWVRRSTIAGALVVLGGVYWFAANSLRTALHEGWQEGFANADV